MHPELELLKNRIKKFPYIYSELKKAKSIRGDYLILNRYICNMIAKDLSLKQFRQSELRLLHKAFTTTSILLGQIRDTRINEKYKKIFIVTLSKFRNEYNKIINIQVEKTCLIRQVMGYDLSRIVTKYLGYE
jgi:uncharacterized membrane protein